MALFARCLTCGAYFQQDENAVDLEPRCPAHAGLVPDKPVPPWLRPRPPEPAPLETPAQEALELHAGDIAARESYQPRDVRPEDLCRPLPCGCALCGCVCHHHSRSHQPEPCQAHRSAPR